MHAMHLLSSVAIQPSLVLKTQPKHLLGSLPFDITLPARSFIVEHNIHNNLKKQGRPEPTHTAKLKRLVAYQHSSLFVCSILGREKIKMSGIFATSVIQKYRLNDTTCQNKDSNWTVFLLVSPFDSFVTFHFSLSQPTSFCLSYEDGATHRLGT
jgi:hypothetical protein